MELNLGMSVPDWPPENIDDLAKKDPEFAKGLEGLRKAKKNMEKRLNTKAKRDAELQRILKQYDR